MMLYLYFTTLGLAQALCFHPIDLSILPSLGSIYWQVNFAHAGFSELFRQLSGSQLLAALPWISPSCQSASSPCFLPLSQHQKTFPSSIKLEQGLQCDYQSHLCKFLQIDQWHMHVKTWFHICCFFTVQFAQIKNLGGIYCEHEIFPQTNLCGTLLGGLGWRSRGITSFLRTTENCRTFSNTPFAKQRHSFYWEHPKLCKNIIHYMNYNKLLQNDLFGQL